jgi:hypothetical protein
MNEKLVSIVLSAVMLCGVAAHAGKIKEVALPTGEDAGARIASPVYDGAQAPPLIFNQIEAAYERDGQVIRALSKGMFTRGAQYDLDPAVDLAALLTQALAEEAVAMGLKGQQVAEGAWSVGGSLDEVYLQSKQVPYGPVMFFGFMKLSLTVSDGSGESRDLELRLTNMYHRYNAGFGRKDEASEALAGFLLQSAQEIVARINLEVLKAPAASSIAGTLETLKSEGAKEQKKNLLRVGLSGSQEAVSVLLGLLDSTKDESDRVHIINALANLGDGSVVEPLMARYGKEDEDCRLFILKALSYVSREDGEKLAKEKGVKDKDKACKYLANWLTS